MGHHESRKTTHVKEFDVYSLKLVLASPRKIIYGKGDTGDGVNR